MPALSSRGIFLSYRREDAAPYARLLQFQLRERLPNVPVFMDLDSIEPGLDFAQVIRQAVESCALLVVLIGRQWMTLVDEEGRRRLDNPDDYVRFEVQTALERDIRVVPVLVDGARPLQQQQLPVDLTKLARLNALELSYGRYEYDADRLIHLIERVLDASRATGNAGQKSVSTDSAAAPTVRHAHDPTNSNAQRETAQRRPEFVRSDRARAIRVLSEAEQVAQSIEDESQKVWGLARVAAALADIDAGRAARVVAEIEHFLESTDDRSKVGALVGSAEELTAIDAGSAERIARSVEDEYQRSQALEDVARALAAVDPDRAKRVAESMTEKTYKALAVAEVGQTVAATDSRRAAQIVTGAERIARSLTEGNRARVLAIVAEVLAATDPDRAERIARSITDEAWQANALCSVTGALAAIDPDRAERIARSITDEAWQANALCLVTEGLAAIDPDRAERIARSIIDEAWQANALCSVTEALAAIDPDRAERIALSITDDYKKALAWVEVAALAANDTSSAARLITNAERAVRSIADEYEKADALAGLAEVVSATDRDHAARLLDDAERAAQTLTRKDQRVWAMMRIASV